MLESVRSLRSRRLEFDTEVLRGDIFNVKADLLLFKCAAMRGGVHRPLRVPTRFPRSVF